jgi:hypothetical protein
MLSRQSAWRSSARLVAVCAVGTGTWRAYVGELADDAVVTYLSMSAHAFSSRLLPTRSTRLTANRSSSATSEFSLRDPFAEHHARSVQRYSEPAASAVRSVHDQTCFGAIASHLRRAWNRDSVDQRYVKD